MKTLLKNGKVINVFTGEIREENILIEDEIILGVGDYTDADADAISPAARSAPASLTGIFTSKARC